MERRWQIKYKDREGDWIQMSENFIPDPNAEAYNYRLEPKLLGDSVIKDVETKEVFQEEYTVAEVGSIVFNGAPFPDVLADTSPLPHDYVTPRIEGKPGESFMESLGRELEEGTLLGENPKDRLGRKKPPLALVPPVLGIYTSQAMEDGAKKYGPYNWRKNAVRHTVYIEAAMRHLDALLDGENEAPDSGIKHEAHVAACMAILLDAFATGNLIDDRPPEGAASKIMQELTKND